MAYCRCGHGVFLLSRDTGFSRQWEPALQLFKELLHGKRVDGEERARW
jgi:hypothetical protein